MVDAPNEPLSDKWLSLMPYVFDSDMDAVIIVGSDDLVTADYIEACAYMVERGADFIYMDGAYFYDAVSGRMIWGNAERLGLGRCLSRRLLERLEWTPWPEGLGYGLDGSMSERVKALRDVGVVHLKECRKHGLVGMDIKTDLNMWSFDHIRNQVISYDADAPAVLNAYFPSVADTLLNWNNDEH